MEWFKNDLAIGCISLKSRNLAASNKIHSLFDWLPLDLTTRIYHFSSFSMCNIPKCRRVSVSDVSIYILFLFLFSAGFITLTITRNWLTNVRSQRTMILKSYQSMMCVYRYNNILWLLGVLKQNKSKSHMATFTPNAFYLCYSWRRFCR